jgi:hypothetical protein
MEDLDKFLMITKPALTSKERLFVRAFTGDTVYALRTAGYDGKDEYLIELGRQMLSRTDIKVAIMENLNKAEKKESAILSKIERMELLSALARNSDPYTKLVKNEFGVEDLPAPPSIPERLKAIDMLNKMEGEYTKNINVKHEYSLSDMVLQSYQDDTLPIDTIEAEYLRVRDAEEEVAPIEPPKPEGLFL